MRAVLGFDTSCYTTSAALCGADGEPLSSARRLLEVADGARGLRQSEGLFQHVKNLPGVLGEALSRAPGVRIAAVAASTRPRPREDSYMPVFRAGEAQARAAAQLLCVPFYAFSHQEGHVRAARYASGIDASRPFLALHLSGGTTETLLCGAGRLTLLGGSLDLHAGQLVDRIGVRLSLGFPAGPALERLARAGEARGLLGASVRGVDCSYAGAETKLSGLLAGGMRAEDAAAEVFDLLARTILRTIEAAAAKTGCDQALLAGGVASSSLLRELLLRRASRQRLTCALRFARPELSGDNAVGVALLGADALAATEGGKAGKAGEAGETREEKGE